MTLAQCFECWAGLGAMVKNNHTRHLCKIGPGFEDIICFTYWKQSKLEVGEGLYKNEAAKVRMLALFQEQVKLLSWSDCD